MVLKPFFSYFGSKYRIARTYPPPEHADLIEPCAGSACYALHYPTRRVLLIEKNPVVAALWKWLVAVKCDEVLRIPIFGRGVETVDDMRDVAPEARTLVGFWVNKGSASPRRSPSHWMRQGLSPSSWWGFDVRLRIAQQVQWIRHWRVIEGSYEQAPDVEATWFIDPPYESAGSHYPCGSAAINYTHLAVWSRARRGLVIACENEGATWLPFTHHVDAKASERYGGGRVSCEVIYVQRT